MRRFRGATTASELNFVKRIHSRNAIVAAAFLLLGVVALRDLASLDGALPWRTMTDFPDFYCAGRALDAGKSPYTYEPLHTCEHAINRNGAFRAAFFAANTALAVPAPLPAYDFLPFMALGQRVPAQAAMFDATAILVAVLLCTLALCRLGLPLALVAAALALSTAYMELNTGQIVPFALLALTLAGLALARRRYRLAGVLAAFTAIEPVVGVPVIAATLLFVPRARWSAAICLACFAAVAYALVGASVIFQYVTAVLPAQSTSEVHFPFQYSLAYLLAHAGMPTGAAALAGTLSYFLVLAVGLALAPSAARRLQRPELVLFVPALCSTIGGTYLHAEELCFAIPALLVLAVATRGTPRVVAAIALCVFAVPWVLVWGLKPLFVASIFVCATILFQLRIDMRVAILTLFVIAATIYAFELHPPSLPLVRAAPQTYAPTALVQNEWRYYAERRSTADPLWLAIKVPTWAALIAALLLIVRSARRSLGIDGLIRRLLRFEERL